MTWTAPSFQNALSIRHLPDWRRDQLSLRYADEYSHLRTSGRHTCGSQAYAWSNYVNRESECRVLIAKYLTIGFARRFAAYKRGTA